MATSDATTALAEARRAQDLAEDAYALARQDFDSSGGWGRGGVYPVPFPIPMGGGWSGGFGGGVGGGGSVGGGFGGGGGGSVGGRW